MLWVYKCGGCGYGYSCGVHNEKWGLERRGGRVVDVESCECLGELLK